MQWVGVFKGTVQPETQKRDLWRIFTAIFWRFLMSFYIYITFSHLADAFIQIDLQMRTMEAIKINKRAMICKCYNKSQLA